MVHEEMCAVIRKELRKERKVNPVQTCATCTDMIMYDILGPMCKYYHAPTFMSDRQACFTIIIIIIIIIIGYLHTYSQNVLAHSYSYRCHVHACIYAQ